MQRGGSPSAYDRILASRLGAGAIDAILEGQRNVMIGIHNDEVVYVPFSEAIKKDKPLDKSLIKVLDELSINENNHERRSGSNSSAFSMICAGCKASNSVRGRNPHATPIAVTPA